MELRLLGPVLVVGATGAPIATGGPKPTAVLARLAVEVGRSVAVDTLISDLWGPDAPAGVANSLQRAVSKLRRAVGRDVVVTTSNGYCLDLAPDAVDATRFTAALASARRSTGHEPPALIAERYQRALALWRGEALAEFAFDEWAAVHRTRLHELRAGAEEDRFDALLAAGETSVVAEIEAAVIDQPLRERRRAQLMLALYRSGRQADALRAYRDARRVLVEELGLEPGEALRQMEAAILARSPALDGPTEETHRGPSAPVRPTTNVRPPLTPTVGRRDEIDHGVALAAEHRMVTIVGPGGVGKTRLATEVALRSASRFDEVWVVELAPVADGSAVASTVVATLGVADPTTPSHLRLTEYLADRRVLLVLDNCEHVLDDVAGLVEAVLEAGPASHVVATSREPLRAGGEVLWALPALSDDDAVTLFVERARADDPTFVPDVDVTTALCRRLDGLPLAIELAAARVRGLGLSTVAARIGDRFALLAHGRRTALPRHQTLHAVVAWSYDLLDSDERALFRRLAVFAGAADLTTVEAVCGDDAVRPAHAAAALGRLVDKSMVEVVDDPDRRYRLLETLREFARQQSTDGEAASMAQRHLEHFADAAHQGVAARRGHDQRRWILRMRRDIDDIRLAAANAAGDLARTTSMLAGLGWYWWMAGGSEEGWARGRAVFADGVDDGGASDPDELAVALSWTAFLALCSGDRAGAAPLVPRGLASCDPCRDPFTAAYCRQLTGRVQRALGDQEGGTASLVRAAADVASLSTDDGWSRALQSYLAGEVALAHGRPAAACALLVEAAATLDVVGDHAGAAVVRSEVAFAAEAAGDHETMVDALRRSRSTCDDLQLTTLGLVTRARLGHAALLAGDVTEAERTLAAVERDARAIGYRPALAFSLDGIARLGLQRGDLETAHAAASEALVHQLNDLPGTRASTLATLGLVAVRRHDGASAEAHLEQALAEARRWGDHRSITRAEEGLAEVARLVSEGGVGF